MARFTLKVTTPNDPTDKHLLRVSRDSMKMACPMLGVMGGPNHYEAASNIERLTRVIVAIEDDCTCRR